MGQNWVRGCVMATDCAGEGNDRYDIGNLIVVQATMRRVAFVN